MNDAELALKRVTALLIDALLTGVLYWLLDLIMAKGVALVIAWTALLLRDVLTSGSPGHRLLGLLVIDENSPHVSAMTSLKRNLPLVVGPAAYLAFWMLFSLVPLLGDLVARFLGGVISLIVLGTEAWKLFTDPSGRRIGDLLAGTHVIRTDQ